MDKKGILGILLAAIGLAAWIVHKNQEMKAYQIKKVAYEADLKKYAEVTGTTTPSKPAETSGIEAKPAASAASTTTPQVPETVEKLRTKAAEYVFTNLGGGLSRVTLDGHIVDKKSNTNVVINEFGTIPIGAVSDVAGEKANGAFTVQADAAAGTVTYERVGENQLALTKKFTLPKYEGLEGGDRLREEYLLNLDLNFTNRGTAPLEVPAYWVHLGSAGPLHAHDAPLYMGLNYLRGEGNFGIGKNYLINLSWFAEGGWLLWKRGARAVYPEKPETMKDVRWASVANQYFCTMATPQIDPKAPTEVQLAQRGIGVWGRRHPITAEEWTKAGRPSAGNAQLYGIDGAVQMNGFTLAPGESVSRKFQILAGPSEYRRLRQFNNGETEIFDFGMFGWISKGLLNSLNGLKGFLGHYWAAICVLTIIIRSAMWPLQNRATQTAKKMQILSPKLKAIQERYKEDPMRLQQETGKLWKEHGINPLGGCLPLLVQIPIFFGFYNMLNKAVELRNQEFLWVQDLSQPDTIAHLAGIPVNILPLVMAVTMVVQMQLTPKAADPMQQRILMFMPLIFVALCYNYAAALALYWSVQNVFSIVQLWVTRDKQPPAVEVIPPSPQTKKSKRRT